MFKSKKILYSKSVSYLNDEVEKVINFASGNKENN